MGFRNSEFFVPATIGYCECGKPAYDKRGAISAVNKRWRQAHVRLRAYPCGGHWHVTKQV